MTSKQKPRLEPDNRKPLSMPVAVPKPGAGKEKKVKKRY